MSEIIIRQGRQDDAPLVLSFVRSMLEEMASRGGHTVNPADSVWSSFAEQIAANLARDDHVCFIAEGEKPTATALGLVAANVASLDEVFAGSKRLHISAVYVLPSARRQGVGRRLLDKAIQWGQDLGCEEAELHVLVTNPARRLYEAMGFRPFELAMVKRICDQECSGTEESLANAGNAIRNTHHGRDPYGP